MTREGQSEDYSYGSEGDRLSAQCKLIQQKSSYFIPVKLSIMSEECDVCQKEHLVQQVKTSLLKIPTKSIIPYF